MCLEFREATNMSMLNSPWKASKGLHHDTNGHTLRLQKKKPVVN